MIRHTFRLMWNRKRRNMLLTIEILISFVVLFIVSSVAISSTFKYLKPMGFSHENRWVLSPNRRGVEQTDVEVNQTDVEVNQTMQQIYMNLSAYPEIRSVSWMTGCLPYGGSWWSSGYGVYGQMHDFSFICADDNSADALDIRMLEGRWFGPEDDASSMIPVVVTRGLRDEIFGDSTVLGAVLTDQLDGEGDECVVVGVAEDFRFQGEFAGTEHLVFQRTPLSDTNSVLDQLDAIIAVQHGVGVEFEERLSRQLAALAPGWNFKIETLTDRREAYLREEVLFVGVLAIISAFLIFNVALGLFGVLWYSISRRRGEIGLRRAVGAPGTGVSWQVLAEALVLATFAIVAGCFLSAQFPLLAPDDIIDNTSYLIAMACSALIIYLIVSVCAYYPSRLAARIPPAEALHVD